MVTLERVKELLDYSPDTGVFTWKFTDRNRKAGAVAGVATVRRKQLSIDNSGYPAHRVAWLYVHGKWPDGVIDHINGDWLDNRIANLRDVTQGVNLQNQRNARAGSKSGLLGVRKNGNNWMAMIQLSKRQIYLGTFADKHEAHRAYLDAKRQIHAGCTI